MGTHPRPGIEYGDHALSKRVSNVISTGVPMLGAMLALLWFRTHQFTWAEASCFLTFYAITGVGIGVGFHRTFTHQAVAPSWPIKVALGLAGSMAFQGPVIRWVADHRRHHRFTDVLGDTHSPHTTSEHPHSHWLVGLFHAHYGWLFDRTTTDYRAYAPDVLKDPVLMFFSRMYWPVCALSIFLPSLFGYLIGGVETAIGCGLVGGCVRTVALHNVIWAVNSIGHTFGSQEATKRDSSRNHLLLALLTFGEGWHNNHHAKPRSAFNDWKWTQIDVNGYIIRLLVFLGLAKNAVHPDSLIGPTAIFDAQAFPERVDPAHSFDETATGVHKAPSTSKLNESA